MYYEVKSHKTSATQVGNFLSKPALLLSLIAFFFISFRSDLHQSDWELVRDESGIKVYSKKGNTAVKSLKLTTTVTAKHSAVLYLLLDKPNYPNWVFRCVDSYEIKKISDFEYYHYQETQVPWPAENRDMILHFKIAQDPTSKTVTAVVTAKPDYIPVKDGKVRITQMNAQWVITPLAGGESHVEYMLTLDPGGSVPNWVVNMGLTDGPVETIKNMKSQLGLDKYKYARLPFIRE